MEALSVDEIPTGGGWQYEPKWDGFRCLVFRKGRKVDLQSKSGRPLTRYFPELVEAVLKGLYDDNGVLHHVGFTSTIANDKKKSLTAKLEKLISPPGFTGNKPGGPGRWSTRRSAQWQPLKPKLVVEVCYDHFTGGRFRHGAKFLRWRPDKLPRQCTMEQVEKKKASLTKLLQ